MPWNTEMTSAAQSIYYQTHQLDGVSALLTKHHSHSFPAHYHDTYQITLTQQGVFKNRIGPHLLHALPGQVCITHPGEVHTTLCDDPQGHSFFTLYLPPSLFNGAQPQFETVIDDGCLRHQLLALQHAVAQTLPEIETLVVSLINTLLTQHQVPCADLSTTDMHFDLNQLVNLDAPFCLTRCAAQFGLDKYKFLRLFKRQTGLTPNQYVILQRIKNSQQLLSSGEDLTEVALACGFYDLPHFHKHFKKITGVTPAVFQHAHH